MQVALKSLSEPLIQPIEPFDQEDVEESVWADLRYSLRVSHPDVFAPEQDEEKE